MREYIANNNIHADNQFGYSTHILERELHFKTHKQEKQCKVDFLNKIEQLKFQMMMLLGHG